MAEATGGVSGVEWRWTARGPQVALSSGWREELPGELSCAARPQGLQAEGSPLWLGTSRAWQGQPGACLARPVEAHCSGKGGKRCWRLGRSLGSVSCHVCREGVPSSPAASPLPRLQLPCGATGLGPVRRGPLPLRCGSTACPDLCPAPGSLWAVGSGPTPGLPVARWPLCSVLFSKLAVPALLSPPTGSFPKDHDQKEKGSQG